MRKNENLFLNYRSHAGPDHYPLTEITNVFWNFFC